MAIDPVLTSATIMRAGPAGRSGAERLSELVRTLELVAEEMNAPGQSQTGRTVLRARFHDLQRQVNRLDGIVAGEGLESSGQEPVTRAGTSTAASLERIAARSSPANADIEASPANADIEAAGAPAGKVVDVVA